MFTAADLTFAPVTAAPRHPSQRPLFVGRTAVYLVIPTLGACSVSPKDGWFTGAGVAVELKQRGLRGRRMAPPRAEIMSAHFNGRSKHAGEKMSA